jgi:hypothetical protein
MSEKGDEELVREALAALLVAKSMLEAIGCSRMRVEVMGLDALRAQCPWPLVDAGLALAPSGRHTFGGIEFIDREQVHRMERDADRLELLERRQRFDPDKG